MSKFEKSVVVLYLLLFVVLLILMFLGERIPELLVFYGKMLLGMLLFSAFFIHKK